MVALMVVVVDEGFNLSFEITWQEVVFEQNTVLESLVPAFDLALSLGMIRRTAEPLLTPMREQQHPSLVALIAKVHS